MHCVCSCVRTSSNVSYFICILCSSSQKMWILFPASLQPANTHTSPNSTPLLLNPWPITLPLVIARFQHDEQISFVPSSSKVLPESSGALLSLEYSCGTFLRRRQSVAISKERGSYFVPLDMPEEWVRIAVVRRGYVRSGYRRVSRRVKYVSQCSSTTGIRHESWFQHSNRT